MRHSFRAVSTVLMLFIIFGVYKFKEYIDQEVSDNNQLWKELSTKQRELELTNQELLTIRTSHEKLSTMLKETESKVQEKDDSLKKISVDNSVNENNLKQLIETSHYQTINSIYKKWTFIKDTPRYKKVSYVKKDADPSSNDVIVLSVIGNSESYGKGRSLIDFLKVLESMEYDWNTVSLGILIGQEEEFNKVLEFFDKFEESSLFSRIVVIHANYIEKSNAIDRESRHEANVQKERRRNISKSRNFLLTNAIEDESFTLWLDSDVVKVPKDMIKVFLETGKDVVVPRIAKGTTIENYDFNSWKGSRAKPSREEEKKLDSDPKFVFVPKPNGADHLHEIMHKKEKYGHNGEETFITELDSVGGAVLWVKSEIFKQGVMFPPYYIIGTKWSREGYDGIETEGLCFQAKTIGYSCWGMPNYVAYHVEEVVG